MKIHDILGELESISLSDDFDLDSRELTTTWKSDAVGAEAVPAILAFMESHPRIDYGAPGNLVFFLERYRDQHYIEKLIASIHRRPTPTTLGLLNRAVNELSPERRRRLLTVFEEAIAHPLGDHDSQEIAKMYLEYQQNQTA